MYARSCRRRLGLLRAIGQGRWEKSLAGLGGGEITVECLLWTGEPGKALFGL